LELRHLFSVISKEDHYFLELYDSRVMEAMKCNNLLYIPIEE
jgi:hypothetical protein